jgi:hypothetical protein
MPDWPIRTCRGRELGGTCERPVIMAKTERGNWQPVNPEPREDGNLMLFWHDHKVHCRVASDLLDQPGARYWPHHGTCPDVELFR